MDITGVMMHWTLVFLITKVLSVTAGTNDTTTDVSDVGMCRDRSALLYEPRLFRQLACTNCYAYLFQFSKALVQYRDSHVLTFKNRSLAQYHPTGIIPDPSDTEGMEVVCFTLTDDECVRWTQCCQSAVSCCAKQLTQGDTPEGYCSKTWDGYGCWDDTPPATLVTSPCPFFLDSTAVRGKSRKRCSRNGTWEQKDDYEWTDYRPCADKKPHLVGVYISVSSSSVSILLLIPSVIIFCVFKELFHQHRVRVHVNFFMALTLSCVATILWFALVQYDKLTSILRTDAVMYHNPVWCRVLSFFKIYLTACTFTWMFCEAFYLHRLISNAFQPPKSLLYLYMIGWVFPAVTAVVYSVMRGFMSNERCWVWNFGVYEWIIYTPNALCLFVSLVFLCNILRILVFEIHSHPNEPNNFRRGLKATIMLVPLFGLQLFLTIYRPPTGAQGAEIYDYLYHFNANSQGIFVSLIFCFFNSETLNLLRVKLCRRNTNPIPRHRDNGSSHVITTVTTLDNKSPSLSSRSRTSLNHSPKVCPRFQLNGTPTESFGIKECDDGVRDGSSVALHFTKTTNSALASGSRACYTKLSRDPLDC